MRYSSTSGGAGTMAEKVVAGSVPMATATSMRSPRILVATSWGTVLGCCRCRSAGGQGHEFDLACFVGGGGAQAVAEVLGGVLLALPVHAGGLAVVDLHAVHADVALAGFGIAGGDAGEGDEAAAVLRPGLEDGELEDVDLVAVEDDFLAGSFFGVDGLGEEAADFGEHGEELELVQDAGGDDRAEEGFDALGDVVEGVDLERETHAALGAELVHQDLRALVAGDVFEEQRGASGLGSSLPGLGGAVGDLGHLEDGGDLGGDALQLASFIERLDPVAQTFISHSVPSS